MTSGIRKHYMTLCFRGGNVEITHINRGGRIEVTFEQAINNGFNNLVIDIDGNILYSEGFSNSDIDFYRRFLLKNRETIVDESEGKI